MTMKSFLRSCLNRKYQIVLEHMIIQCLDRIELHLVRKYRDEILINKGNLSEVLLIVFALPNPDSREILYGFVGK